MSYVGKTLERAGRFNPDVTLSAKVVVRAAYVDNSIIFSSFGAIPARNWTALFRV
jgi:hypothetical protein